MFLSRLAMRIHSLTLSTLNGTYHETDSTFFGQFGNELQSRRLRALVHQMNTSFAENMRVSGRRRKICLDEFMKDDAEEDDLQGDQLLVSESEMKAWVKKVSSR